MNSTYTVEHRRGRIDTLSSVDEVLALDNTRRDPIREVRALFEGSAGQDYYLHVELTYRYAPINSDDKRPNIAVSVDSNDSRTTRSLFAELSEQVERTKTRSLSPVVVALCLLVVSIGALFVIFPRKTAPADQWQPLLAQLEQDTSVSAKLDFLVKVERIRLEAAIGEDEAETIEIGAAFRLPGVLITVPVLVVVALVIYAVTALYPHYVFLWGDWSEHHAALVARRRVIWQAVIIAFIVAVLASLLADGLVGILEAGRS